MKHYLCAVEAVNLDSIFSDCHDLSTTRGGGLAVLRIGDQICKNLGISPVSAGASQGIFELDAESELAAVSLVREELGKLELHGSERTVQHATIMAAAVEDDGSRTFAHQVGELKAKMRWAQMRSPSVIYPRPIEGSSFVCDIDHVRPARQRDRQLKEKSKQSDFTFARRASGRQQKEALLREILTGMPAEDIRVVSDLNDLANGDKGKLGNTQGKIAVLRFDGNSFGARVAKLDRSGLREFSRARQEEQRRYIRDLIEPDPARWRTTQGELRLEVVVYGGDEVTLIVPAWLGWQAARVFFAVPKTGDGISYAGGLVFCHCNAPIHSIKRLTSDLADAAKDYAADTTGQKGNFLVYQALESFDSIGRKLETFHREQYGRLSSGYRGALLGPEEMSIIGENMEYWRSTLAKRQLHKLVMELLAGEWGTPKGGELDKKIGARLVESKGSSADKVLAPVLKLWQTLGDAAFIHILELWDYVGVSE